MRMHRKSSGFLTEIAPDVRWRGPWRRPDETAGPGGAEDTIVLLLASTYFTLPAVMPSVICRLKTM